MGIDSQSFIDQATGRPCKACEGEGEVDGQECAACEGQGLIWPEVPYTDADRAYDLAAFGADYGIPRGCL